MLALATAWVDSLADGIEDQLPGIRFAEVARATAGLRLRTHPGIVVRRDENYRRAVFERAEPLTQLQSGCSPELDVQQQTIELRMLRVSEESFSRQISDRLKMSSPQQPTESATSTLVIVNNCYIDFLADVHLICHPAYGRQARWDRVPLGTVRQRVKRDSENQVGDIREPGAKPRLQDKFSAAPETRFLHEAGQLRH
jgi:hypothetical protein